MLDALLLDYVYWCRLLHGGHGHRGLRVRHVALAPHLCHGFQLSVEVDALRVSHTKQTLSHPHWASGCISKPTYRFAVEVHVTAEGSARSGEREHG